MPEVFGVYQFVPTIESINTAINYHKYFWMFNDRGEFTEKVNWYDLKNLSLVEFQVFGDYSPDFLINIEQNGQAPYLEFYLDQSGTTAIEEEKTVKVDGRRVCFFMHFLDPSKSLTVGDQELRLPVMTMLPDRLLPFTHFVPVD